MNFNKKIILNSLDDTSDVAKEIASELETYPKNKASIIFLEGDLGSGKTTLVKEILKSFGLSEPVTSPTFTIIEPYLIKDKKIYHIDLYRIESRKELEVLGIEEYSAENDCLIFIEWPEKAEGFFSEYDLKIRLSHINEISRELIIEKS